MSERERDPIVRIADALERIVKLMQEQAVKAEVLQQQQIAAFDRFKQVEDEMEKAARAVARNAAAEADQNEDPLLKQILEEQRKASEDDADDNQSTENDEPHGR